MNGRRKWLAGDVLNAVREINPDFYYPKPIRAKKSMTPGVLYDHEDFTGDYLTRERFSTLYDICSRVIHVHNPYDRRATAKDYEELLVAAPKWRLRIQNLLQHHEFRLMGDKNLYIVQYVTQNTATRWYGHLSR